MKERFGATDPRAMLLRTHTQTAGVSLTAQQPLNNVARVAIQALAAVLGGAQSLHTNSYDETWALPTEEAVTLALRTQQILAEETGVTHTVDPLGGAYFVEALTDRMEAEAWRLIRKIDELGGMLRALDTGFPQQEIADSGYRTQLQEDAGERVVVGVNRYVQPDEKPISLPPARRGARAGAGRARPRGQGGPEPGRGRPPAARASRTRAGTGRTSCRSWSTRSRRTSRSGRSPTCTARRSGGTGNPSFSESRRRDGAGGRRSDEGRKVGSDGRAPGGGDRARGARRRHPSDERQHDPGGRLARRRRRGGVRPRRRHHPDPQVRDPADRGDQPVPRSPDVLGAGQRHGRADRLSPARGAEMSQILKEGEALFSQTVLDARGQGVRRSGA